MTENVTNDKFYRQLVCGGVAAVIIGDDAAADLPRPPPSFVVFFAVVEHAVRAAALEVVELGTLAHRC